MSGYPVALSIHLLSLMLATCAASLAWFAACRLRTVKDAGEALQWLGFIRKVVRAFPVATLGLLASGGYMTEARWAWSVPWVIAALVGLAAIMVLGAGVEGRRNAALARELVTNGLTDRARDLLRDPIAWTAKLTTETLLVAIVLMMILKPSAEASAAWLVAALAAGALIAVPFWRVPGGSDAAAFDEEALRPSAIADGRPAR